MPRNTPVVYREIAYAESSGDGELEVITIDHDALEEPLRFVRNPVSVVHGGQTYEPFEFKIKAPQLNVDGSVVQSTLSIDAVDLRMILALRSIATPASLVHTIVLASDPNTITNGPWRYEITGEQSYDAFRLELQLTFEPVLEEQCPWKRLSPSRAPGLF